MPDGSAAAALSSSPQHRPHETTAALPPPYKPRPSSPSERNSRCGSVQRRRVLPANRMPSPANLPSTRPPTIPSTARGGSRPGPDTTINTQPKAGPDSVAPCAHCPFHSSRRACARRPLARKLACKPPRTPWSGLSQPAPRIGLPYWLSGACREAPRFRRSVWPKPREEASMSACLWGSWHRTATRLLPAVP